MQRITVVAVFAAVLCIVKGRPGDLFPQVWCSMDLHEVLKDLPEQAKQEWKKIHSNNEGTVAERNQAKKEWAKKYGLENQWNEFVNKRQRMISKTKELLERLPKLYEEYLETWDGHNLWKNVEKRQTWLAARYKKEFKLMWIAKELVERSEHKVKSRN